jgi:hypothetical protein
MKNQDLFNYKYSLEDLIKKFASQEDKIFYLNTSNGLIEESKTVNSFAFKPITIEYAQKHIDFNKNLSFNEILTTNNEDRNTVYNFIKDECLEFLAKNKILPPSLHPMISFEESKQISQNAKIKVEIK